MKAEPSREVKGVLARLLGLARRREPEGREVLYTNLADLFANHAETFAPLERELSLQILGRLAAQVEIEIREALALRLADRADVPAELILMLASDAVRVAEPVLLNSPVLTDDDLVLIVRTASPDHQHAVARRPALSEPVSEAIVEHGADQAVVALITNETARIPVRALRTLVVRAAANQTLHAPLAHRRDLPPDVAARLYGLVSGALRDHIRSNFALDPRLLDEALARAMTDLGETPDDPRSTPERIVDKIDQAGRLAPAFLVRSLMEGRRDIFIVGFARLLGATPREIAKILDAPNLKPLTLACRAIGIDRAAFGTIVEAVRTGDDKSLSLRELGQSHELFDNLSAKSARARLAEAHFID